MARDTSGSSEGNDWGHGSGKLATACEGLSR